MKTKTKEAKELLLYPEREYKRIMLQGIVDLIVQNIPKVVSYKAPAHDERPTKKN